MATYRADIEYEGTRYRGWQIQANARSIAGELRRAAEAAGLAPVEIGGAGRTDAGVHALRQTAHLRTRRNADPEGLRRTINDTLPADIHVLDLRRVADRFHARHDAVARSYLYQIGLRRSGLAKRYIWWVRRPLDHERMAAAAASLVGLHDFASFCERPREQADTRVKVEAVEVRRTGDLLLVRLVASHFLWKMVRRSIGALVRVGTGELSAGRLRELLDNPGADAARIAEWTAPPSGLFLERVVYPGEPPLGALVPAVPLRPARVLDAC